MTFKVFFITSLWCAIRLGNTNDHAFSIDASKGIAGVPRASLVVVAATCGMFDIPIEGIAYHCRLIIFVICFEAQLMFLGCIGYVGGRTMGRKNEMI
jgi:hypothetical protein